MTVQDNFRTCVIVNPSSQGGRTGRKWGALADLIRQHFGPFEHRFTTGPGDGTQQARAALGEGFELIVALGGDGTLSEVANGFVDNDKPVRADAVLGLLPAGTGGDFRKTLGIPKGFVEAASALRGRERKTVDLGRIDYQRRDGTNESRYFLNIASFGISGLVDETVGRTSKRWGGRISFLSATVKAQLQYQNQKVRLRLDGADWQERIVYTLAVANGRYFGGGMKIAPDAKLDDALFDVIAVGDMSRGEVLLSGFRIYAGTHLSLPKVARTQAKVIEAEPTADGQKVLLDVDGEALGMLPAQFRILPKAIQFKVPAPDRA